MRNYEIEQEMYRRAAELIETRYPTGWGGAGIVHTSKGNYYTSVSIETANASAALCIETGAMLEAHKFNEKVTHCLCLVRAFGSPQHSGEPSDLQHPFCGNVQSH